MKKLSLFHIVGLIGAILIVLGTIYYLFMPNLFSEGMLYGGDEAGHMFIPKFAVDYFLQHHRLPIINPYWYNGAETFHSSPSLAYIPIAIIYFITKDIYLSNRIFTLLLLLAAGMSMFYLLYKRNGIRSALIGAIIFPFSPLVFSLIRTSLTRAIPFILMPLVFYFTDEVLEKKYRFRNLLILAIIMAAMFLGHPLMALSTLIPFISYILLRLLFDRKIDFNKFLIWLSAFLMACGLIAWFAIPFLLEPSGYSYASENAVQDFRRTIPYVLALIGIPLVSLGLFSFLHQRNRKNWILLLSVILILLCYTPMGYIFYKSSMLSPWYQWYLGSGALLWIDIIVIYWVTTAFEFPTLKSKIRVPIAIIAVPLLIVGGLLYFNNFNKGFSYTKIWTNPYKDALPELTAALEENQNPGRVFSIKNVAKLDWVVPAIARKYYSEGHYFSIARIGKEISWINDAIDNDYPAYAIAKMRLFNDRFFVVTSDLETSFKNNPPQGPTFNELLEKDGFKLVFSRPKESIRALYYKDKPSSYLIPLEEKTLVIGNHAYNYAAFQPNSYIAGSIYLDDYDLEFINNFDNLVLYGFGFHDKTKAEKLVQDYAKSGGRVTIDMLNVENSKLEAEPTFLGVHSSLEVVKTPMQIEFAQNIDDNILPKTLEFPSIKDFGLQGSSKANLVPLKEWRFTEYLNLDSSLARWQNRVDPDNGLYSLVGYKNINGNKVWFVGGNLFYHAYLTHNPVEQKFLKEITTGNSDSESTKQLKINILSQNLDPEAGKMEFSYSAEEATPLLVSYTISPHWKAYLNGQPIKIYNIDRMMAVNLPAGDNHVMLRYENIPIHYLAKGTSVATLILLGVIFLFNIKRKRAKKNV